MSDFGFMESPLERIRALLATALDHSRPEEERREAFEALQSLSKDFLRKLSMDSDWQHVLNLLGGEADGEMPGDGPWSEPEPDWAPGGAPRPSSAPSSTAAILDTYANDLRWLVRDDYRTEPLVVAEPLGPDAGVIERIAAGAAAVPTEVSSEDDLVRRLPWGLMNHGAYLLTLRETWPNRSDLHRLYLEESLMRHADRGVPPRLAARLEDLLATHRPGRKWFAEAAEWVDNYVDAEVLDFLTAEELADRHLHLRMEIARRVRQAEITDSGLVTGLEMYATLRVLRTAASRDLTRAWHDVDGDVEGALRRYDELNRGNELFFDRAFRAVLRQPSIDTVRQLSDGERQAAALARSIRRRGARNSGFLAHGENPA